MLKKVYRLSLAKFGRVGQKFKNHQIFLLVGATDGQNPKFAVVVPARFCKKATLRNRTKRLTWEALAGLVDKLRPANYKIKICDDFSKLSLGQVRENLEKVFLAAGCLK